MKAEETGTIRKIERTRTPTIERPSAMFSKKVTGPIQGRVTVSGKIQVTSQPVPQAKSASSAMVRPRPRSRTRRKRGSPSWPMALRTCERIMADAIR